MAEDKKPAAVYSQARLTEEVVKAEPIYTMVIKSPHVMRATDLEEEKEKKNASVTTNGDHDGEAQLEGNVANGPAESPVLWEYKLPSPPTPFQDSRFPSDVVDPLADSSRHSSMSTDSLQDNSFDEDKSPRPGPDSGLGAPSASSPSTIGDEAVKMTLMHGSELMQESVTEELQTATIVIRDKRGSGSVFVLPKDPLDNQYGAESTTDELIQSPPASLPPLPSTSPPSYSDEDDDEENGLDGLRFSISTYNRRVERDSTYDKKLSRSDSPELSSTSLTAGPYYEKHIFSRRDNLPLVNTLN